LLPLCTERLFDRGRATLKCCSVMAEKYGSSSSSLAPIKLMVFPGAFNWPVWVAQERGLFVKNGVAVQVAETPGSVVQWTSLAEGRSDIAITLMDNVVAYREGQGEAPVTVPDALAVMAADARIMPALMTRPDIKSYADLKSQTLSVDAVLTGLALILFALLEKGGLSKDDYRIVRTGGVLQRFEGLKRHEFAGALFNTPFSSQLEDLGFRSLDTAASIMQRYQGHVVAVREGWAAKNSRALSCFMRAFSEAIDWLYDASNRDDAFAIFRKSMPAAGMDAARIAYSALFDPKTGFAKKGEVDLEGVAQVLELRSRFGTPAKTLGPPKTYFDPRYLEAALRG
jgi:ABC-type nitrate/sulfonate/bicarbonate transport system substrate-binding protein